MLPPPLYYKVAMAPTCVRSAGYAFGWLCSSVPHPNGGGAVWLPDHGWVGERVAFAGRWIYSLVGRTALDIRDGGVPCATNSLPTRATIHGAGPEGP